MTQVFTVSSGLLEKNHAEVLADALEAAIWPEAVATTLSESEDANGTSLGWVVEGYYEQEPTQAELDQLLENFDITGVSLTIGTPPDVNWVEKSLEGLAPINAGTFFVHGSHDRHLRPMSGTSVEIDAGIAFGTGHHGTTRGCLLALDRLLKFAHPLAIADVGCGTGVLAIAAAKRLRQPVLASDIDPDSIIVTRENARKNYVGSLVHAVCARGTGHPDIQTSGPYDLVLANILANPLKDLAPDLTRLLAPGGRLILSGLLVEQEQQVRMTYRNYGAILEDKIHLNGWSTLTLQK